MSKSVEELLASIPKGAMRGYRADTKFAPKLSFEERCEVMAYHASGVSIPVLAAAFSLHRRTVGSIVSEHSPYYKSVRDEFHKLGDDAFIRKYARESGAERITKAASAPEVQMNEPAYRGLKANGDAPDKRKSSYQGMNTSTQGGRFEIAWKEKGDTDSEGELEYSGWYYRDVDDPKFGGMWQGGADEKPFVSSKAAYDKAMIEIRQH